MYDFIVPVYLISLNFHGFMLSARNKSTHKTHYALAQKMFILTKLIFNVAWVVFSFILHIFIYGWSMLALLLQ